MRISTGQIFQGALGLLLQQQYQIARTQQQLASGKRILSPADDPAGSATLLGLDQSLKSTQQYQDNIGSARSRLNLEESTLSSMTDLMDRVRELAVQANSPVLSDSDRQSVAAELGQQLDQLLSLSNTRDSNGEYIFAGYQSLTQPFSLDPSTGSYAYQGDAGQRFLQVGASRQVAVGDSGRDVFLAIRNGNGTFSASAATGNTGTGLIAPGSVLDRSAYDGDTYTISFPQPADPGVAATAYQVTNGAGDVVASGNYASGGQISFAGVSVTLSGAPNAGDSFTVAPSVNQDMFTTVGNLLSTLKAIGSSPTSYANAAGQALSDIDQAMENINAIRAQVGSRLQALDSQENLNADSIVRVQDAQSQLGDLDYASAITQLNQQMVGLDAAQKSFMQIQNLSLFKYF